MPPGYVFCICRSEKTLEPRPQWSSYDLGSPFPVPTFEELEVEGEEREI